MGLLKETTPSAESLHCLVSAATKEKKLSDKELAQLQVGWSMSRVGCSCVGVGLRRGVAYGGVWTLWFSAKGNVCKRGVPVMCGVGSIRSHNISLTNTYHHHPAAPRH